MPSVLQRDRSLRSDLGRRGLTEIDARGRLQVRSLTDRMILEKDYEVLMKAATIEDRTQFAKAYAPDDDLALVHAIRGGDVAAFEQLVKRYDSKLLRIARNVTHNSEDARPCRKPFSRFIRN